MHAGCGLQGLSRAGLGYTAATGAGPESMAATALTVVPMLALEGLCGSAAGRVAYAPAAASLEEPLGAQGAAVGVESSGSDAEMGACPRQGDGPFRVRQAAGGALLT